MANLLSSTPTRKEVNFGFHALNFQRKQGNTVHKRLQTIDAEIKRLQQVHTEVAAQKEIAQQELDRVATGFAKVSASYLASVVLSKLPRELRDLVYLHLVDSSSESSSAIVVRSDGLISRDGSILGSVRRYSGKHSAPPFLDPELFGTQFAAELAEYLYRNMEFKIEDVRLLGSFIDYDVFKAGRAPRDNIYFLSVTFPSSLRSQGYLWSTYTDIAGYLDVLLQASVLEQRLVPFIYAAKDIGLRVEVVHALVTYPFHFDRTREAWDTILRAEEELSSDEDLGPGLFD